MRETAAEKRAAEPPLMAPGQGPPRGGWNQVWSRARKVVRGVGRSPALLAVVAGVGAGTLLMLFAGYNPVAAYTALFRGAVEGPNLSDTVNRAAPIVGMGMCAAIALRAGLVNLGGEGQLVLGGMAAAMVAIYAPLPGPLLILSAMLAAAIAGGLYGALAAVFDRWGVPLLIGTLLMNYPARQATSYLARYPLRDITSGNPETHRIADNAHLPAVLPGGQVTIGLLIVAAIVLVALYVNRQTPVGLEIRLAGLSPRFARYSGVHLGRMAIQVMFAAGACGGIVGAIVVLGSEFRFIDGNLVIPAYTWIGLMAALLARSNPLGVAMAGTFFAALQIGAFGMEATTDVPREMSQVLQALIILFLAVRMRFALRASEREAET